MKYSRMRWNMLEWDEEIQKVMKIHKNRKRRRILTSAPCETRNSTIWKFWFSHAIWRAVLEDEDIFQNEMKYFRVRWNIREWDEIFENEMKYSRKRGRNVKNNEINIKKEK
jgi:hypothetical protein